MYNPSNDTESIFSGNGFSNNGKSRKIISIEKKLHSPEFLREFELDLPGFEDFRVCKRAARL